MKTKASQQYKALNQRVSSQIEYTRARTHTQVHSFKVEQHRRYCRRRRRRRRSTRDIALEPLFIRFLPIR